MKRHSTAAPQERRTPQYSAMLACALSGALLFLSAPPVGLAPAAFIALIPLLHTAGRAHSYRLALTGGFAAGAVFFLPALYWLTPVTYLGWVALSLYCAAYVAAFAVTVRASGVTVLPLAACWVLLEYFRGTIAFTGFPWLLLSQTQASFAHFTQILDVVGSYGLSGILVAINVLLYKAISGNKRSWIAAAAIVTGICAYGFVRFRTIETQPLLRIALVQASVPQEMKLVLEGQYNPKEVLERYLQTSRSIPADAAIDLLVWPETVVLAPYTLNVNPDVLSEEYKDGARFVQAELAELARRHNAHLLAGANSFLPAEHGYVSDASVAGQIPRGNWRKEYNSAYLIDPSGSYVDRYDKMHLVPFGEYIPLPNLLPFLASLVPFDASLSPGESQTIFEIDTRNGTSRFGVLICYEDTDSHLARNLRRNGADFFVNISNDAWFGLSELDQHYVAARFRAIENRVGVVRSGNNGITGVIDPFGESGPVLEKNAIDVGFDQVRTTNSYSLYTRFGDWPAVAASVLVLGIEVLRRKNRNVART